MKRTYVSLLLISALVCMATCDGNIQRPCGYEPSTSCIRQYFEENSNCVVVTEPNESPVSVNKLPLFAPMLDATFIVEKIYVENMKAINEVFYVNTTSGNLVYSISFDGLSTKAPDSMLVLSQLGKEPKVLVEDVNVTYYINMTAVIPLKDGKITVESLEDSDVTAYYPNSDTKIEMGPKFSESDDPDVAAAYKKATENMILFLKEVFLTKAPFYFFIHLENSICRFGVRPNLQNPYDTRLFDNLLANADQEPSISEPCANADDMNECARDYFEKHGQCSVVRQADNEPFHRESYIVETPWVGLTAEVRDAKMYGLNGKIRNIYRNKQTGNTIILMEFKNLSMSSPEVPLFIHQQGAEPNIFTDYNKDYYPMNMTVVIGSENQTITTDYAITAEDMKRAYVTVHFLDNAVDFDIGPHQAENEDPQITEIIDKILADPVQHAKEMFVTEAYRVLLAALQKYFCDFNLPIDPPTAHKRT